MFTNGGGQTIWSLSADLEFFDNPEYHDKLTAADSTAVANLLWNALSCISASVSFIGAFLVLYRVNILYGILMMAAAFPSSIAAAKYTKSLYRLSLTQVSGERQKRYYQNIAVDKEYAQDVRLFDVGTKSLDPGGSIKRLPWPEHYTAAIPPWSWMNPLPTLTPRQSMRSFNLCRP